MNEALLEEASMTNVHVFGHGDTAMSIAAIKNGAVAFLSKPVSDDELLHTVRVAIEKDRLHRQIRKSR